MSEPTIFICPPPAAKYLSRQAVMAVGFGVVAVYRDGEAIWTGDDENIKVEQFARMAGKDPDHEWIIEFTAPLQEQTYQRQSNGRWLLTSIGPGFA